MSRYLRRQQERDARRNIDRSEKVIPLPALLDEFTIFDTPQLILESIKRGEIAFNGLAPVFRDNSGKWQEVCPALEGWIFTWNRISLQLQLGLDLDPLRKINKKLEYGMLIKPEEIAAALAVLDCTRLAFRSSKRSEIAGLAKTAQIMIFNEDKVTA